MKRPEFKDYGYVQKLSDYTDQVEAENKSLRKYAVHVENCEWKTTFGTVCTCGLDKILNNK